MRHTIVTPADLTGQPLQELKAWLGVTRDAEDDALLALLHSSLEMCEAYTGIVPLEVSVSESITARPGRCRLVTHPAKEVISLAAIMTDTQPSTLNPASYTAQIDADGNVYVSLKSVPQDAIEVRVELVAGLAADWSTLAAPLKHGIIRLAAHLYRDRDQTASDEAPASVTAIWRPWRRMSLS